MLFKAKSNRRTRSLRLPKDQNVSVQYAEKANYRPAPWASVAGASKSRPAPWASVASDRPEHAVAFLRQWLDPFTPERRAAGDWRILMMDCATSHLDAAVVDFCEERGYVVLYHYGCTTGIAQVNDTDLHGRFSQVYIPLEDLRLFAQLFADPGNISRTLVDVSDDAAAAGRRGLVRSLASISRI